jgi:hypothetical protein
MMNNRSSLSSQRAALEAAACKEEDSPPPTHSPQNTNRGKLDQKLDSKMEMEDGKSELNDIKIKQEDSEDRKMNSKTWIEQGEIKKEKNDGDSMDTNANEGGSGGNWEYGVKDIKREVKMETDDVKVKIKEEAMSPASTSDNSQALVKSELKLEPVPNTTDIKKKCSKFFIFI